MRQVHVLRSFLAVFALIAPLTAAEPLVCPAGAPLGRFELTVVPPGGGAARALPSVNRMLPGDKILYQPGEIDAPEKKRVRIALLLVPSEGSKIVVFDPKPADEPASWTVPFRVQLASLVWGPAGLNKAKVTNLVAKNDELIGQLADYAQKTEETQALIQAITEQQAQDMSQNVDAAVAGFASQFPSAKIDRTQSTSVQLNALLHGVNPSLAAYDPLSQNPSQQAAQTAGLAAAVAGLFFGGGVGGLAAGGGAVLINLHSLLFPQTEFLSALSQTKDPAKLETGLCGAKAPPSPRTEIAFLWATRVPDAPAPAISIDKPEHLAMGVKSAFPLHVKAKDWSLAARVQDWRLVSPDGQTVVPVPATVDTKAKTIALDLTSDKLKPDHWKLAANWDWDPINIQGELILHDISRFDGAHLTPASQDKLNPGAGTLDLALTGADFEFVRKIEYKKRGDPFAQPQTLPFHLPKEPADGPESSLLVRMDAGPLTPGKYVFLIAQADGKIHDAPFQVLPAPPSVSGLPLVLNTGGGEQPLVLHGKGLDRIERIWARNAQITLGDAGGGDERNITVKVGPGVEAGTLIGLSLQVKDFQEPVSVEDALLVAGPRPAITKVRESAPNDPGIALNPGEMALNSLVSFELTVLHAPALSAIRLSCDGSTGGTPLKIKVGENKDGARLIREAPDTVFVSFRPESVGDPGCQVMATLATPADGESAARKLGAVVRLPKIEAFELTGEKAGDGLYVAVLRGQDLETIGKVGWDAQTGTAVDAIPTPIDGPGNKESLRAVIPWPAPAPHAPLYVWLRGEDRGRLTSARY